MSRNSFKYVAGVTLSPIPTPVMKTINVGTGKGECAAGEGKCKEHLTAEQWYARRDSVALNIASFEESAENNPMSVFETESEREPEINVYTASTDTVGGSMLTLNQIQARLSGLHFAQEALSDGEREILYMAEALLHRVNEVNDIVKPRKPRQPRQSSEMKSLTIEKTKLEESIEIANSLIYTYQQDLYNKAVNNRKISGLRRRITILRSKLAVVEEKISQL